MYGASSSEVCIRNGGYGKVKVGHVQLGQLTGEKCAPGGSIPHTSMLTQVCVRCVSRGQGREMPGIMEQAQFNK